MRKLTALAIGYMLGIALCASGIILNTRQATASDGGASGGGSNQTLDIFLWSTIITLTVTVIVVSAILLVRDRYIKHHSKT
jgi:hypothetical protein